MTRERQQAFFLDYLRKHAGTYATANLVYDVVVQQPRHQAIETLIAYSLAWNQRMTELQEAIAKEREGRKDGQ